MSAQPTPIAQPATPTRIERTRAAFILIVSLFLFWGVANGFNGVLVKQFRKAFTLDYLQAVLVDTSFYIGYFAFAIPAALFIRRFGYKWAVVLGLLLYGVGALLFWPASEVRVYAVFLGALFIIASGLAFLETAANPLVTVLGPASSGERRLNFAQSFNAFGPISAVLIGRTFILSNVEYTPEQLAALPPDVAQQYFSNEAHAVQLPYLILGLVVIVWAALVYMTKFPAVADRPPPEEVVETKGFGALFRHGHYLFGVVAQFFYVGAQAGTWGLIIPYAQHAVPGMPERGAAGYALASFLLFMVGRFAGTALMGWIAPRAILAVFAAIAVALTLIAALAGGDAGLYALTATSFFMSIMFPTIFASSIRGLGALVKPASSLLIMAIIGGALLPLVMGRIADLSTIQYGMLVPAVCFAVIFLFAAVSRAPAADAALASSGEVAGQ